MNQFTYFLLPSGWNDEADASLSLCCCVALFNTEECVRSTEVRWAYFTLSPWSKTITNGLEIEAAERSCRNISTPLPPWHLFNFICKWVNNELLCRMLVSNVTPSLGQQPIVLHGKKWGLRVGCTLTPPNLKKKKSRMSGRGESSGPQAMRNLTGPIHKNHQRRDAADWGAKRGLVSVHLAAILIWVITLQIEHSRSTLLAEEHNEVCRWSIKQCERRGISLKKKKKSKAPAGMAIISARLLESDKGAGPCRKGCSAPGLLGLTDIPPTGTHCRLIASANGKKKKKNISACIWSLSDTVHVVGTAEGMVG